MVSAEERYARLMPGRKIMMVGEGEEGGGDGQRVFESRYGVVCSL